MTTILITIAIFAICLTGMSIGVIVAQRELRGSCGGEEVLGPDGNPLSCGTCPRKEVDVCPTDSPLVALAQIAHPDPRKHRH